MSKKKNKNRVCKELVFRKCSRFFNVFHRFCLIIEKYRKNDLLIIIIRYEMLPETIFNVNERSKYSIWIVTDEKKNSLQNQLIFRILFKNLKVGFSKYNLIITYFKNWTWNNVYILSKCVCTCMRYYIIKEINTFLWKNVL